MNRQHAPTWVAVLALLGACSSDPWPAPQVSLAPDAPTTIDDLSATVTPPAEGAGPELVTVWTVDGREIGDLEGSLQVQANRTAKNSVWEVSAFYVDDRGTVGDASSAAVTILNTPPTATLSLAPQEPDTDDDVVASVIVSDVDEEETSFVVRWLRNGEAAGIEGDTLPGSVTGRGEVWTAVATPSDADTEGEPVQADVSIANKPPVVLSAVISPDRATEQSTLRVTAEGTDPDEDPVSYRFQWMVNGVEVGGQDGESLTGAHFDRGDSVRVVVTPYDGFIEGAPFESDAVVIDNTPPTATGASISPAELFAGTSASCGGTGWSDVDGDPEGYRTSWEIDGAVVSTDATLDGSLLSKGKSVACVLTPWDGTDAGPPVVSADVVVKNTPPTLASASIDPAAPASADALSVSLGTLADADGDPVTATYVWTIDGTSAGTGSTLSASATRKGQTVAVTVTPFDGEDSGTAVTASSVTIKNAPPVISSVSLSPSTVRTDGTLTASVVGSDADGDSITYRYAWTVNGSAVSASGSTLSGETHFDKGDVVAVTVTPDDGDDTGAPVTSSSVTVANTPPSLAGASLSPSSPKEKDTLTCAGTGFSDADGDSETLRYAWQRNGSTISGATASTLSGSSFARGDRIACVVTPYDGTDTGSSRTSSAVTVVNTPPVVASASLSPSSPKAPDTVTATVAGVSDDDGDTVTLSYAWRVDGKVVSTSESSSSTATFKPSGGLTRGSKIDVQVTPNDGLSSGSTVASASVTVANSDPKISSVSISSPLRTASTATASATTSDPDSGDRLTVTYAWTVNGKSAGGTGSTLASSSFKKGDSVGVTATVSDGTATASSSASPVTVANTAPTLTRATLTPSTPSETDTLTCAPDGFSDADGDTASYTYAWTVDGKAVSGATSSKLTGSHFDKGDKIACRITPSDGTDSGPTRTSPTVTAVNTPPKVTAVVLSPTKLRYATTATASVSGVADADGDTVSLTYEWLVAGKVLRKVTKTSTTDAWKPSSGFEKGSKVSVQVTPNDGTADGPKVLSAVLTVGNTAPTIPSASVLGPLYTTTTARPSVSWSDVDGDTLTPTYAWTVNSKAAGSGSSLSSSSFSRGDKVGFTITVSDGTDTASRTATALTVQNTAPTRPTARILPGKTAYDSQDLQCTVAVASTDADKDAVSYSATWYVDGKVHKGKTSTKTHANDLLLAAETAILEKWTCELVASDGSATATSARTASTAIQRDYPPKTPLTSSYGVLSGDPWTLCSATSKGAWMSADVSGTYEANAICTAYGYRRAASFGTTTSVCKTASYNGKGGSTTRLTGKVHWTCDNLFGGS